MEPLKDIRGVAVEVGDTVAWSNTHCRGHLLCGTVLTITETGLDTYGLRYKLKVSGFRDGDKARQIRRTGELVVVEKGRPEGDDDEFPADGKYFS